MLSKAWAINNLDGHEVNLTYLQSLISSSTVYMEIVNNRQPFFLRLSSPDKPQSRGFKFLGDILSVDPRLYTVSVGEQVHTTTVAFIVSVKSADIDIIAIGLMQ